MICTNCFEHDLVEATTHIECVGTVSCMKCPGCEYEIFTQDQSDIIDNMRKKRDAQVHDLLKANSCRKAV
jgi:hypothetical protein